MVQINLLPNIKRDYLKAQQMKHLVILASFLITVVSISLLVVLFIYVQILQPRHRQNIQTDIDSGIAELKDKDNSIKIVTVQGVLEQIPALQDQKMITSSLFNYLNGFTPRDVSYTEARLDTDLGTLTLTGSTKTLEKANILANNLKSAKFTYTESDTTSTIQPFSSVVFATLGKAEKVEQGSNPVTFQLTVKIDTVMFKQSIKDQKLVVDAASEELQLPTAQPFSQPATGVQQ